MYGNSAQMSLMVNAIQYDRFERLIFYSVGETSCSDVIGRCFVDQVPALSIPCYGERRFGHAADDELVIGCRMKEIIRYRSATTRRSSSKQAAFVERFQVYVHQLGLEGFFQYLLVSLGRDVEVLGEHS